MLSKEDSSPSNASGARNSVPSLQTLQRQRLWRIGPEIEMTRQSVRKNLRTYISLGRKGKLNMQYLENAVNRVERRLFYEAKSKAEYENPATLAARLQKYIAHIRSRKHCSGVPNSSSASSLLPGNSSIPAPTFHDMSVPSGSNHVHFQNGHALGFNGGVSHGNVQCIEGNMLYNYSSGAGNNQNLNQFDFHSNLGNGYDSSIALSTIPAQRALNSNSIDCSSSFLAHAPPVVAEVCGNSPNTIYQNGSLALNSLRQFEQQILNSQQSQHQTLQQHAPFDVNQQSRLGLATIHEDRPLNSNFLNWNKFIPAQAPPVVAEVRGTSSNTIYQNGSLALNNVRQFGQQIPNSQQSQHQTLQQHVPFDVNQQSRLGLPAIPGHGPLNTNSVDRNSSIPAQVPWFIAELHGTSPNTAYQNSALAPNNVLQFEGQIPNFQQSQHQTLQQYAPYQMNQQSMLGVPEDGIGSLYRGSWDSQFQQFDPHQDVGLSSMSEEVSTAMSLDQKDLKLVPQSLDGPSRIGPSPSESFFAMYSEINIFQQPQGQQKDEDFGGDCMNSLKEFESLIKNENYGEPQQLSLPSSSECDTKGTENENLCATPIQVQIHCPVSNECDCEMEHADDPALSKEHIVSSQKENAEMDMEYDHAKSEINEEIVEPCSKNNAGEISEKSEKKNLSLIDTFTVEQIEEHIASLRQVNVENDIERSNSTSTPSNENVCRLCAEQHYYFRPIQIFCSWCGDCIKKNTKYHSGKENNKQFSLCKKCYTGKNKCKNIPGVKMEEKIHTEEKSGERWVHCAKCEGWQHEICALFNNKKNKEDEPDYTCPKCYIQEIQHGERVPLPPNVVPGAKELPRTSLSDHIEKRLFASLEQERQERAAVLGKDLTEVEGAEGLTVRVVCNVDKSFKVNQRFWDALQRENYPREFPYKSKAILLFQKIDAVDVIIFAMYAQEYGPECNYPNKNSVYISYLDSVKYLRPQIKTVHGEALRTFIFHELLIGYLDYCKRQGFSKCHIWTCAPSKKYDYIFYCHPNDQKIPTNEKLRKWYLFMLKKAIKENIVVAVSNLYDHFYGPHSENKVTAANLPYFEGDYLPTMTEKIINRVEEMEEKVERKAFTRGKRKISKCSKANSYEKPAKDIQLLKKFKEDINGKHENFIIVHLQFSCALCSKTISSGKRWFCNQCKHFVLCDECYNKEQNHSDCKKPPTKGRKKHIFLQAEVNDMALDLRDEDENPSNKFIETRDEFLRFCVMHSYQFDTLRRAKHSTAMILYHLHDPSEA